MNFMDAIFTVLENITFFICLHQLYGRVFRLHWKDIVFILANFIILVLLSYSLLAHIFTVIVFIICLLYTSPSPRD